MTKLYEVQESLFQRLDSDNDLKEKVVGVFDYVPEETNFPYVVLGRIFSTPANTKTTEGENVEVTIDVWSMDTGKKETVDIMKAIEASLTEELAVEDAFVIDQKIKSREVLEEINDLYHGTIIFEILIDLE